jgi:predicted RNA-binding Zn-ribbon protein involved in translation (DUF1610 family)
VLSTVYIIISSSSSSSSTIIIILCGVTAAAEYACPQCGTVLHSALALSKHQAMLHGDTEDGEGSKRTVMRHRARVGVQVQRVTLCHVVQAQC